MTKKKLLAILKLLPSLLWWGAALLTLVVVVIFLSAHFRGEVPRLFGYSVLHIVSDSMEPTIEKDSYVLIKKTDPAEVRKDDVICFYSTDPQIYGYPNTHRVVAEPTLVDGEYRYVTAGDKSQRPDSVPAEGDRLIGVLVRELGGFTALMHFISRHMILLFAVLFLVCAAAAIVPLFLKKDKGDTQS